MGPEGDSREEGKLLGGGVGHRLTAQTTSSAAVASEGSSLRGKSVWAGCFEHPRQR